MTKHFFKISIAFKSLYSSPKYAVAALKRKILDKNPHVSKFALVVNKFFVFHAYALFYWNFNNILDFLQCLMLPCKFTVFAMKVRLTRKVFFFKHSGNLFMPFVKFQTLEACMKNCGGPIHDEVATREFMDDLRNLANVSSITSVTCPQIFDSYSIPNETQLQLICHYICAWHCSNFSVSHSGHFPVRL